MNFLTLSAAAKSGFLGNGHSVIGEVSTVNDDANDNRFLEPLGRYPHIDEDTTPTHLLCNEY